MSQNLAVVQAMYDAFARQDHAAIRRIFDPEIEWLQMDGFPMGGHHHGVDQIFAEVFAKFRLHWLDWAAVVDQYLDAGSNVVALGHYVGTAKQTGRSVRAPFAHVYTVQEGRIIKFVQYTDTLRVHQALYPDSREE